MLRGVRDAVEQLISGGSSFHIQLSGECLTAGESHFAMDVMDTARILTGLDTAEQVFDRGSLQKAAILLEVGVVECSVQSAGIRRRTERSCPQKRCICRNRLADRLQ